jgi:hypothetical protein
MKHQPYSPDLASNDFWLFLKIQSAFKNEDIKIIRTPKKCDDGTESYSTTGVTKCCQQWQHRWAKCVAAQGEYFEGEPFQ